MNPTALKSTAQTLELTSEQKQQQDDLAARLMNMAMLGVPTAPEGSPMTHTFLALQALLTAFAAVGSTDAAHTEAAARMAFNLSSNLIELHENRMALQADSPSTTTQRTNHD